MCSCERREWCVVRRDGGERGMCGRDGGGDDGKLGKWEGGMLRAVGWEAERLRGWEADRLGG